MTPAPLFEAMLSDVMVSDARLSGAMLFAALLLAAALLSLAAAFQTLAAPRALRIRALRIRALGMRRAETRPAKGPGDAPREAPATGFLRRPEQPTGLRALLGPDPAVPWALREAAPLLLGAHLPALVAGLAALLVGVLLLAGAGPAATLALPGALLGVRGASALVVGRWRARLRALLPDAIGAMVRSLRAGVPVVQAVAEAAREAPPPLGPVLASAHDAVRLGQALEGALWDVAQRVRLAELDFLCVAIGVQRETGGNLAETLTQLEESVRKRLALAQKVKALSSEARASAAIIGALPVVVGVALLLVAPDYLAPLLETAAGQMFLGAAVLSLAIGAAVMAHLVGREARA